MRAFGAVGQECFTPPKPGAAAVYRIALQVSSRTRMSPVSHSTLVNSEMWGHGLLDLLAGSSGRGRMKLLFDFFPVVVFFITFKMHDDTNQGILVATAVIIVATIVQVAISWMMSRKVEKMHIITLVLVVTFGGITLLLEDEIFIKWKPTVVNWLFALAFLGSEYISKKSFIRRLMEGNINLPEPVWKRLNLAWVGFFLVAGALNLYVVYNFDTDTWVNFKLFGLLALTVVFMVLQGLYLMRHVQDEESPEQ